MKAKRILLIGGGHTHIEVIRQYPRVFSGLNTELVLVSPEPGSAYSGMMPGVVAGHYHLDQILINLPALCEASGVVWHQGRFVALEPGQNAVRLADGHTIGFDYLSFDIGSVPSVAGIEGRGARDAMLWGAKPVIPFIDAWERFLAALQTTESRVVTVVGGGVAGFELALAMHHRVQTLKEESHCRWQLISNSALLAGHNRLVRRYGRKALKQAGFDCYWGARLRKVEDECLSLSDGRELKSHFTVLCTPAGPVQNLSDCDLPLNQDGFIPVNEYLQVIGHENMFAVGDIAGFPQPLAKAGVYAVRQGPILTANLRNIVQGKPLNPFSPQHRFLKLITLGRQDAMASRGWLYAHGAWVWRWKNQIDSSFMEKYQR